MAEMKQTQWAPVYLSQYRRVPELIGGGYDPDVGEEVLNHLLDRDEMESARELMADLQSADESLADALAGAEPTWRERIDEWAAQCDFDASLWWVNVWYKARRRLGCPVSLADVLKARADAWVKITGHDGGPIDAPGAADQVFRSLRGALRVSVAEREGFTPSQRGPGHRLLSRELARFADASLAVVVPGSLTVGLQLPRENPEEPASAPPEESLSALDLVMAAGARYDPQGDAGDLSDLIGETGRRTELWKHFRAIYTAGGASAEAVQIESTVPSRRTEFTWSITGKPSRRAAPRPEEQVTVVGDVRAVDLDKRSIRIRAPEASWPTEVTIRPSLFLDPRQLGMHLGKTVTVNGYTRDQVRPPREMTAVELPT